MKNDKKMKKSLNIKTAGQFVVAGLILSTATGVGVNASALRDTLSNSSVISAIKSGDLNAYKDAVKSEETSKLNQRLDSMTQDDLNTMKVRVENDEKKKEAIKNNDWETFNTLQTSESSTSNKEKFKVPKTVTRDEFDKMVSAYKIGQDYESKINDALKNNDQTTFTNLMSEIKVKIDELKSVNNTNESDKNRLELSEDEKNTMDTEMYEKALKEYQTNGKFSIKVFGIGRFDTMDGKNDGRGPHGKMHTNEDANNSNNTSVSNSSTGA